MTSINEETLSLLELLPNEEQVLAKEFIKRMVLAWDSDFTKLTPAEELSLKEAEDDIKNGNVYSHEEVKKMLGI
ncbi:MAG: hypothetical protein R3Y29_08995 [bacterium]